MRAFADLQQEPRLARFLGSQLGTLYTVANDRGLPVRMVRHFDGALPPALVASYVELVRAAQEWVERHPDVERLVRVEQPVEVGGDFVARPYHVYYTSTRTYTDWDNPPKPPRELKRMRRAVRSATAAPADDRDALVREILTRNLLEPSGKTYFHEGEGRFIVVEPTLTREDVARWAALSDPISAGPEA